MQLAAAFDRRPVSPARAAHCRRRVKAVSLCDTSDLQRGGGGAHESLSPEIFVRAAALRCTRPPLLHLGHWAERRGSGGKAGGFVGLSWV